MRLMRCSAGDGAQRTVQQGERDRFMVGHQRQGQRAPLECRHRHHRVGQRVPERQPDRDPPPAPAPARRAASAPRSGCSRSSRHRGPLFGDQPGPVRPAHRRGHRARRSGWPASGPCRSSVARGWRAEAGVRHRPDPGQAPAPCAQAVASGSRRRAGRVARGSAPGGRRRHRADARGRRWQIRPGRRSGIPRRRAWPTRRDRPSRLAPASMTASSCMPGLWPISSTLRTVSFTSRSTAEQLLGARQVERLHRLDQRRVIPGLQLRERLLRAPGGRHEHDVGRKAEVAASPAASQRPNGGRAC